MTAPGAEDPAYVAAVLTLYLDLPDTPLRPSPLDQALARRLQQQAVPLVLVESALLLATLRRLSRPSELPPLPRIRSLSYFLPVIAELQEQPLPDGYLDYLRLKLRRLSPASRPGVQKHTFSDDR
jgi:hypothetical protein